MTQGEIRGLGYEWGRCSEHTGEQTAKKRGGGGWGWVNKQTSGCGGLILTLCVGSDRTTKLGGKKEEKDLHKRFNIC